MTYQSQDQLENDETFQARVRSCVTQQSDTFINDGRPDISNTAYDALRGAEQTLDAFYRMVAASPDFADEVDLGDGSIDQSKIADVQILASVQQSYPTVASLYYGPDGLPWSGAWVPGEATPATA
jgi:hypothetical protein